MKILHIIEFVSTNDGVYFFLRTLHDYLINNNYEVFYLIRYKNEKLHDQLRDQKWNVVYLEEIDFEKYLDELKPDILHYHDLSYADISFGYPEVLLKNYIKIRSIHNVDFFCPHAFLADKEGCKHMLDVQCIHNGCITTETYNEYMHHLEINKKLDGMTYLSEPIKNLFIKYGFSKERVCYFSNMLTHYDEEDYNVDNRNILFAGRIIKVKGIELLLESLTSIKRKDWKLYIAGNSPDLRYIHILTKRIRDYGLDSNVVFTGLLTREKLDELYKNIRITVFPSICYETYGYSGAEAVLRGIPVIVTENNMFLDWIKNGINGIAVSTTDKSKMTQAIETLLYDDHQYQKYRQNACEIRNLLFKKNIEEEILQFYEAFTQKKALAEKDENEHYEQVGFDEMGAK